MGPDYTSILSMHKSQPYENKRGAGIFITVSSPPHTLFPMEGGLSVGNTPNGNTAISFLSTRYLQVPTASTAKQ